METAIVTQDIEREKIMAMKKAPASSRKPQAKKTNTPMKNAATAKAKVKTVAAKTATTPAAKATKKPMSAAALKKAESVKKLAGILIDIIKDDVAAVSKGMKNPDKSRRILRTTMAAMQCAIEQEYGSR